MDRLAGHKEIFLCRIKIRHEDKEKKHPRMAIMNTNWQLLLSPDSDVPPDVFFVVTTAEHPEAEGKSIGATGSCCPVSAQCSEGCSLDP